MNVDKPTFVIIGKATRQSIQRSPQIGMADRFSYGFHEGELGMLVPAFDQAFKDELERMRATPKGGEWVSKPRTVKPGSSLWSDARDTDNRVLMAGGTDKKGDYFYAFFSDKELIVLRETDPILVSKEAHRMIPKEHLSERYTFTYLLQRAKFLLMAINWIKDPVSDIPVDGAMRRITNSMLQGEQASCKMLYEQERNRQHSFQQAHIRTVP